MKKMTYKVKLQPQGAENDRLVVMMVTAAVPEPANPMSGHTDPPMPRIPTVTNHLTHRSPVSPILTPAPIPPPQAAPLNTIMIHIQTIFPLTAVHPAPPANPLLINPAKVVDWLGKTVIADQDPDSIHPEILGLDLERR